MNIYKTQKIGEILKGNSYAGRGIIIGKSQDGKNAVFAYFIMGRSENSRNRIFTEKNGEVTIYPYDITKVKDPSLIIYSPVKKIDNKIIVTNGDQTDTIYEFLSSGKTFEQALETRCFEPDSPNFTPRVSGILEFSKEFSYKMSILKSSDEIGSACNRFTFNYQALNGVGHFIHTYVCDGNPIPTFQGEPERTIIPNDIESFTAEIWENLDSNNKVSLYVSYNDIASGKVVAAKLINKNV